MTKHISAADVRTGDVFTDPLDGLTVTATDADGEIEGGTVWIQRMGADGIKWANRWSAQTPFILHTTTK